MQYEVAQKLSFHFMHAMELMTSSPFDDGRRGGNQADSGDFAGFGKAETGCNSLFVSDPYAQTQPIAYLKGGCHSGAPCSFSFLLIVSMASFVLALEACKSSLFPSLLLSHPSTETHVPTIMSSDPGEVPFQPSSKDFLTLKPSLAPMKEQWWFLQLPTSPCAISLRIQNGTTVQNQIVAVNTASHV
ncbi:hypothetical protein NE237_029332 [Protea cynaroides]|uniref:Uncharacterized protein n=1 Tax=Protea cynaroides TaxID=273540 RepID=A0A9Q0GS36_9MAGN|nr:hypothetical protein NE237_029332 [Protea cynaroides]